MDSKDDTTYDESNIRVITGQQAIRLRPAMYVGGTNARGLHHLVFGLVDNSIQEALSGHGSKVEVTIHADGSASVVDDGRGIPVTPHPQYDGKSKLEVVLTKLHV